MRVSWTTRNTAQEIIDVAEIIKEEGEKSDKETI